MVKDRLIVVIAVVEDRRFLNEFSGVGLKMEIIFLRERGAKKILLFIQICWKLPLVANLNSKGINRLLKILFKIQLQQPKAIGIYPESSNFLRPYEILSLILSSCTFFWFIPCDFACHLKLGALVNSRIIIFHNWRVRNPSICQIGEIYT